MTERNVIRVAITIIALWRLLNGGGNSLYYVVMKQLGITTTSTLPVAVDIRSLLFDLIFGFAVIVAAPAIADLICGKSGASTKA